VVWVAAWGWGEGEEEVRALKERAKILEQRLQRANRRLQNLEKENDGKGNLAFSAVPWTKNQERGT